ncbi:MAG: hypothetical protein PF508_13855 [Spirochaeta sp.]|jgi:small-conductance mechanosensitive channel|nr:hypothetical protein [Spirochaeta sp.]
MTFGLYLMLNLVILLFFGLWIRRLVLRRLRPERILADLEREVQEVIQSLNNAGDQNISLIEDRIKSLKNLLNRADTQIDEMEARLRQIEDRRAESDEAHGGDEVAPSATEEEPTYTLQLQRPPERIGAGDGAEYIPANDVSDAIDDGVDRLDPRDQVRRLHSQGLSSELIANRTGVAIGEVELIISLGANRTRS